MQMELSPVRWVVHWIPTVQCPPLHQSQYQQVAWVHPPYASFFVPPCSIPAWHPGRMITRYYSHFTGEKLRDRKICFSNMAGPMAYKLTCFSFLGQDCREKANHTRPVAGLPRVRPESQNMHASSHFPIPPPSSQSRWDRNMSLDKLVELA